MGSKNVSKKSPRGANEQYVHGFSREEQERLYRQAKFFEPYIYRHVDFSEQEALLEVGCGVGAQTEILLRRFPHLKITSVDASKKQLERARLHLRPFLKENAAEKRVRLVEANGEKLPFTPGSFDAAFLCWFLEHLPAPEKALAQVKKMLRPGGVLYCNEVMHATFFLHPYSPATLQYWFEFNDHQWNQKGDPFVGAKLGNLLQETGFRNVQTEIIQLHYDNRTPRLRARFIQDLVELLLSAAPGLIASRRVTEKMIQAMKEELSTLQKDPNAVVLYSWVQARAEK
jgi:ubiquinone/menaquinone biosynthesis C-methylase UbiE